jgi:hypothetical protein
MQPLCQRSLKACKVDERTSSKLYNAFHRNFTTWLERMLLARDRVLHDDPGNPVANRKRGEGYGMNALRGVQQATRNCGAAWREASNAEARCAWPSSAAFAVRQA